MVGYCTEKIFCIGIKMYVIILDYSYEPYNNDIVFFILEQSVKRKT